jgi:hypothetical protein
VGTQLLPVNASRRTSNSFIACFFAVDITDRMLTKCSAPAVDCNQPEILWRSLTILMSRSAWLLSKGTAKSVAKRSTSSWCGPDLFYSRRGSVCVMRPQARRKQTVWVLQREISTNREDQLRAHRDNRGIPSGASRGIRSKHPHAARPVGHPRCPAARQKGSDWAIHLTGLPCGYGSFCAEGSR